MATVTIPRFELTSCALSAEVGAMIKAELDLGSVTQRFWTDSKICLGYIFNDVKRYRIFVANRKQKVHDFSEKPQWFHVKKSDNPADHASRGISLINDAGKVEQWFGGPGFLGQPDEFWAEESQVMYQVQENDPEVKLTVSANVVRANLQQTSILAHLETRRSKWKDMVRIMAWVHRVFSSVRWSKPLAVQDTATAELTLLRLIQEEAFQEELKFYGKSNGTTPKALRKGKGNIWRLDPYVDSSGLLRVGGRIRKSRYPDVDRHPVILPKDSVAVRRILEHHHYRVHHGGHPATLNAVRSHGYWVISGHTQVKRLIYACVQCRKYRGKLGEQKMADLPASRTEEVAPFTHAGVDMFGPFKIKEGRKRILRYVSLFTCFSSRAVHLESVNNLSTDNFILALRRFLARRGPTTSLRSDNGGNFVGANNEFRKAYREMDHSKIHDFLLAEKCEWITWETNIPEASHTGGVWERQIRSVRNIMTSLLHDHSADLTDEAFRTLLAEAELIVNSRSLTADTNDPSAPALSPIQLLTLKSKVVLPPPGVFQKEDMYCKRRWRQVQHLANLFWDRYRKEYLQSLQARSKWVNPKRNFCVGDVVLLKDSDVKRQQWPMAKVTKVFPGSDGLVRSVELRVPSATVDLKRPIQKIVLLVEAKVDN